MSQPAPSAPSAPVGLRARKKAMTRDAIAAAALELFLERGADATTVDDIAAAAQVSPRTFFRYFASKDDVVFAAFPDQVERLVTMLRERPTDEPVFTSLEVTARRMLDADDLDPEALRTVLPLILGHAGLHAAYLEWLDRIEIEVAAWAADRLGLDPSDLRPRLLAAAALAARRVATDRWMDSGQTEDLADLLATALDQLGDGLRQLEPAAPAPG